MVIINNLNKYLVLIAFVCLFTFPLPSETLWLRELFNSGHTILFLFISLVLYSKIDAINRFLSPQLTCLFVLAIGLAVGAAIEVFQGLIQREASLADLNKDFLGILAGLALALSIRQKTRRTRVLFITIAFGLLIFGMYSLIQLSWHYVQRNKSFPVVIAFDENWSTSFLKLNNAELLGELKVKNSDDTKYQRVRFDIGKYPGIGVIEPEEDWSAYRVLRFDVYSANDEDIKLVLRVHDKQHNNDFDDRFNRAFIIHRGINTVMVDISQIQKAPSDRMMDLTNIADVHLFLSEVSTPLYLGISNIYIEK
jgi:hypothetical protein